MRDDLSDKLIHFTKGTPEKVLENFQAILSQKRLIGGTGSIEGNFKCVCFTESPIAKLPYVLAHPELFNFPYAPFGVMIDKKWLYAKGGRPVIYQSAEEYNLLPDNLKYRHKTYNPLRGVDFTWEREWRIKIDELSLDPEETTIVVPSRTFTKELIQEYTNSLRTESMIFGKEAWMFIRDFPWHFIALEDLGININFNK